MTALLIATLVLGAPDFDLSFKGGLPCSNGTCTISDDLVLSEDLQVDGSATFNGEVVMSTNGVWFNRYFGLYPGYDDGMRLLTYPGFPTGDGNNNFIITTSGNYNKDHDHETVSPNPTWFIHSATDPDIDNTQWLSLSHDGSDVVVDNGKATGTVRLDVLQGDLPATCTLNQLGFDTAGATRELCFCRATDTWACAAAPDGPAD